jgi:tRNA-dihydrouridine synthase B
MDDSLADHAVIIYSPLAGCSDFPFRKMVRRYFDGLIFCEMVKMDPLVRQDATTLGLLEFSDDMHPIGGQIVGSKPELAAPSAKIIEELGFDVVDLNCGCPVDKVTKDGSGSGLLREPEKVGEIISNMVAAVKIPVTVKIRIGWTEEEIVAPRLVRIAEEAGAQAIAIHGRTRAQSYTGLANRDVIRDCVQEARTIKVYGNGDIFDPQSAVHMLEHTGCDGILLSRGTMGQPWLGEDVRRFLAGKSVAERTSPDLLDALLEHFSLIVQYRNEKRALLDLRRVGPWYCKDAPNVRKLRGALSQVSSVDEARDLVKGFLNEQD